MIRLKIQEVATSKGVSMRKLVKAADISYNTLRMIYRDPYRDISLSTLDRIAIALNTDPRELIEPVKNDQA